MKQSRESHSSLSVATLPGYDDIAIDELEFDPMNPRFPLSLRGSADKRRILEFMLDDAGLLELMASIAQQGFFPGEPLLVSRAGEKWQVIEGNRRLAACYLLNHPDQAPIRKSTVSRIAADAKPVKNIPCLKFLNRQLIMEHLGYRHVTGIKEWEPLAKARFLHQRYAAGSGTRSDRLRTVSRSIGSRSDYVARLLTSLSIYEQIEENGFYDIPNLDESTLSFSLLSTSLQYSELVSYLGMESSGDFELIGFKQPRLRSLTSWLFFTDPKTRRTRLGESRNFSRLAQVIGDPKSRKVLEQGGSLEVAFNSLDAGGKIIDYLTSSRDNLSVAVNIVQRSGISPAEIEVLEEIRSLVSSLRRKAQKLIGPSK